LRDIEQGGRIESDHIVGDLLERAASGAAATAALAPLLSTAYSHLKAYEARRRRQMSSN
jgi:2-dehydropantoate 2-reductase